ncbi:putative thioredoxin-like protein [Rosa chinensis]|uniref:Putative thioredoxin-like protein n=1 Tax=Rosa chinensis TaxID=74649 RepID=A0A2P6SDX8_ROSCH|nr:putative thioredoxin-like protein [Rosa chinensis]
MEGKGRDAAVPRRLFLKGRYMGGSEEVLKIVEEGLLGEILEGLPKKRVGSVCEGCGEAKFLPCFQCNGSSKMVLVVKEDEVVVGQRQGGGGTVVVRCPECNENGLVLCPICS